MPKYTVLLTTKAQKLLDKLSDLVAKPLFETISRLAENPSHLVL
jgi:mRNA-degrading endonuclease RelE of RelBE toxin-antitoxin system